MKKREESEDLPVHSFSLFFSRENNGGKKNYVIERVSPQIIARVSRVRVIAA